MKKPKSLFPVLSQAQLINLMTPKQKAFVDSLKLQGATFEIKNINQRPYIMNIVRPEGPARSYYRGYYEQQEDYDESDYERMNIEDTQAGIW